MPRAACWPPANAAYPQKQTAYRLFACKKRLCALPSAHKSKEEDGNEYPGDQWKPERGQKQFLSVDKGIFRGDKAGGIGGGNERTRGLPDGY